MEYSFLMYYAVFFWIVVLDIFPVLHSLFVFSKHEQWERQNSQEQQRCYLYTALQLQY